MASWKIRGLGLGLLAGACALNAAPAWADDESYTALILGHAFLSQPDATYMQEVINTYVDPTYHVVGAPVSVYTPETDYTTGQTQGVADLATAIQQQLAGSPDAPVVVAGYSMSDSVITQEMINLANAGITDPNLKFVLAEDLNNPDGGIFTRFPGSFGASLPATPADTPYGTDVYTIEYSGASDFPQYYGNLYADLNAANGYLDLHPYLLPGWPAYFNPATVANAVAENTSAGYAGNTDYFLIPTQNLPMLNDLHAIGGTSPFSDLIQPDMRVLVDLGYNWTGGADVSTPATLSNPNIDVTAVDAYLHAGADQGLIAALVDMGILPKSDLAGLADMYPYVPDVANLMAGALTDNSAATLDATTSANLLATDLAGSSSPLASELSTYLPGFATDLANMFAAQVSSLSL